MAAISPDEVNKLSRPTDGIQIFKYFRFTDVFVNN